MRRWEQAINRAANKAEPLLQIEQLLLVHPEGLTQAELARRLGVDRSTIMRNLVNALKHTTLAPARSDGNPSRSPSASKPDGIDKTGLPPLQEMDSAMERWASRCRV